jgi:hypothetical protein
VTPTPEEIGMPRQLTPERLVEMRLNGLARLVRNLLLDNPNLKSRDPDRMAHDLAAYPRTAEFLHGPCRQRVEFILERIEEETALLKELVEPPKVLVTLEEGRISVTADADLLVCIADGGSPPSDADMAPGFVAIPGDGREVERRLTEVMATLDGGPAPAGEPVPGGTP